MAVESGREASPTANAAEIVFRRIGMGVSEAGLRQGSTRRQDGKRKKPSLLGLAGAGYR